MTGLNRKTLILSNWDKSAAIFCCQVAAWFPEMLCNFNLAKRQKIANNSSTTETRVKTSVNLESLEL
jgi:hypothetical protein